MLSWVTVTDGPQWGSKPLPRPCSGVTNTAKHSSMALDRPSQPVAPSKNQLFSPPGLGKAVFKILQDGLPNPRASSQSVFTPSESCFSEQLGKLKQAEDVGQLGAQTPQPTLLECVLSPVWPLWAWTSGPGIRVGEAKAQPQGWPRQASVNCSCPRETPGCWSPGSSQG